VGVNGMQVPVGTCSLNRPTESLFEACNDQSCFKYDWNVTDYGFCSASCGTGVQSRQVNCLRSPVRADGSAPTVVTQPDSGVVSRVATAAVADFSSTSASAGVYGQITFSQATPTSATTVRVKLVGTLGTGKDFGQWHIHQYPIQPGNPAGQCDVSATGGHYTPLGITGTCDPNQPKTCELGDLSGKFGHFNSSYIDSTYVDITISVQDIIGKSLVIHDLREQRWVCANIVGVVSTDYAPTEFCTGVGRQTGAPDANLTKSCYIKPCPTYSYAVGEWSECTKTCGSGVRARSEICKTAGTNVTVADARCASATHVGCGFGSHVPVMPNGL
jgi:Cu/Zn superoxide dismutase